MAKVPYLGRFVDEKHFRVFVYNKEGRQRIAESFTEFQNLIDSGSWFDTLEGAKEKVVTNKRPYSRKKKEESTEKEDDAPNDALAFEVME